MNQIEDQTSDAALLGPEPPKPRSEFTRPAYQFKGMELFPFTYGYELLFNQVRDAEDTGLFTWMAFVFLLMKRNGETPDEHRKWAINIAWRVAGFREALIQWMDEHGPFTNEDKLEAKRIYDESLKAVSETTVNPIPGKGARTTEKKTRPKKQQPLSTS